MVLIELWCRAVLNYEGLWKDYVQIHRENLKSSARRFGAVGCECLNDPKHTSKVIKKWLNHAAIEVLEWSSWSPEPSRTCGLCWRKSVPVSQHMVIKSARQLTEACEWLSNEPNWGENGPGTFYQILEWLYVYCWTSRFGYILVTLCDFHVFT